MKRIILLTALALALGNHSNSQSLIAHSAATALPINLGEFKFEGSTHDFGKLIEGSSAIYRFKFTNVGHSPILISNATSSCECTVPQWSKMPIQPGMSGEIQVSYDTNDRIGEFNKTVTISSNAKKELMLLIIRGVIIKKS